MPTCAAGAELRYLLDRLPQHLAVFVFETDTRALSAVLHLVDLAAPLQSGRCLLLPPGREAERLRELLEIQVGLLPPGDMLLPDLVSAERSRELRTICEQVMTEALGRRNTQLNELHSKWEEQKTPSAAPASGNSAPRVAVLSLVPHPPTHALAACLMHINLLYAASAEIKECPKRTS